MTSKPASCRSRPWFAVAAVVAATMLLGACAETRLAVHAAKEISRSGENTSVGEYKVGKPYTVNGVRYYPRVDYTYSETGIASWYGPQFHNRRTANGQMFDMNAITAAHRTLPLPSVVRVTNLKNGRSLKVLVNDRGPFARGRIIDVSRRTAQLLGFERAGTAPVRVEIVPEDSRRVAQIAQGRAPDATEVAPPPPVQVAQRRTVPPRRAAPPLRPVSARVTVVPTSGRTQMYIQAASFVQRDLAVRSQRSLERIAPTRVIEAQVGDRRFYRVRVGPFSSVASGDAVLDRVVATGYPDARLIVD